MKSNFAPVGISIRSFGQLKAKFSISITDAPESADKKAVFEAAKVIGEKIVASPNFSSAYDAAVAEHGAELAGLAIFTKRIIIPPIVDTLEWLLTSPPNVHQFEEPPVLNIIYYIYLNYFRK